MFLFVGVVVVFFYGSLAWPEAEAALKCLLCFRFVCRQCKDTERYLLSAAEMDGTKTFAQMRG